MIDISKIETISSKLEPTLDKKLAKLNLRSSSSNVSVTNEGHISCNISEGTNHDTSYYGGTNPEHVPTVTIMLMGIKEPQFEIKMIMGMDTTKGKSILPFSTMVPNLKAR